MSISLPSANPIQITLGFFKLGKAPAPLTVTEKGRTSRIGSSMDLKMRSILDSSILPKNFRVRWIFSGLTHRTSARVDLKSPWTSSILARMGLGSSMARKDRINQNPFNIDIDVNTPIKKVNQKNPLPIPSYSCP